MRFVGISIDSVYCKMVKRKIKMIKNHSTVGDSNTVIGQYYYLIEGLDKPTKRINFKAHRRSKYVFRAPHNAEIVSRRWFCKAF